MENLFRRVRGFVCAWKNDCSGIPGPRTNSANRWFTNLLIRASSAARRHKVAQSCSEEARAEVIKFVLWDYQSITDSIWCR